jgi:hypothetical protein
MPSPVSDVPQKSLPRRVAGTFEVWNRRLHFYIGLYLLFFLWLFAFTGLLLNHPKWTFADFWPTRRQTTFERQIKSPLAGPDLTQARNILKQLGLTGEIEWTSARADSRRLDFRASRPGQMFEIKADFDRGRATVQRIEVNAWGVMRILHTFTGVRAGDSRNQRDWVLTSIWAFSMDAVAIGLLIMVFGSYYMWWRQPRKRAWGLVALLSGWMTCALFVVGLRLLL